MAYQPLIPTGSVPLNQDYLNIRENFNQLNTQFNTDHVPLTDTTGTPPNGYHTVVHQVPFSTPVTNPPDNYPIVTGVNGPAAIAGYGQLFGVTVNDGQNTDSSLYYLSGGGRLTQMTRNIQPLAARPGYTFLPGGLLLQWGLTTSSVIGVITFPIPFTTGTFLPVVTLGPASGPGVTLVVSTSATSFVINQFSISTYWMAIGQ